MEGAKVTAGLRKAKKKPVKDELDRIKQAEKKKRRLEKALATSLAIRSELEKKKLRKKEEQERLDEEGAAIAEAVALHVLLGEDSEDPNKIMQGPTSWDHADIIIGGIRYNHQDVSKNIVGCVSDAHNNNRYGQVWDHWGNSRELYFREEISAGHLAAQAVSSLKIADDTRVEAYMYNRMLRG